MKLKNRVGREIIEEKAYFFDSNLKVKINNVHKTVVTSIMALHKQIFFFLFEILMYLEQEKLGNILMLHKSIQ